MGSNGRKPPNPQKAPKYHGRKPSAPVPPKGRSECCFAGQAVKSVLARRWRLAARFARLDLKVRTGRLVWR